MSKVLSRDLHTSWDWSDKRITIPKGTPVIPATNLPGDWYWVELPDDGTDVAKWANIYGFKVGKYFVCDKP